MAEVAKSVPAPVLGNPGELCCGNKDHAPAFKGKPLVPACELCPNSSIYFRDQEGYRARRAANPDAYPHG